MGSLTFSRKHLEARRLSKKVEGRNAVLAQGQVSYCTGNRKREKGGGGGG